MNINKEIFIYFCNLSKIKLNEKNFNKIKNDFSKIIKYISFVNSVNINKCAKINNFGAKKLFLRDDIIYNNKTYKNILHVSKYSINKLIKVPKFV